MSHFSPVRWTDFKDKYYSVLVNTLGKVYAHNTQRETFDSTYYILNVNILLTQQIYFYSSTSFVKDILQHLYKKILIARKYWKYQGRNEQTNYIKSYAAVNNKIDL